MSLEFTGSAHKPRQVSFALSPFVCQKNQSVGLINSSKVKECLDSFANLTRRSRKKLSKKMGGRGSLVVRTASRLCSCSNNLMSW